MKHALITATLALVATLHAQDPAPTLAPELAPLAAKHKADAAALDTQRAAEISRLVVAYSAALDSAEKVEATARYVPALAAITVERGDLKRDEVKADVPRDLPKGLYAARKTYLGGVTRVVASFRQRQQRIIADYVQALSALQSRMGSNAALVTQITAEKERVLKVAQPTDLIGKAKGS